MSVSVSGTLRNEGTVSVGRWGSDDGARALALAEGGVYCGLPRDLAVESAIQTVLGTAEMCKRDPQAISALRNAVITPNGTTARGIHVLDVAGFRGIVENCVIAAAERSAELGRK